MIALIERDFPGLVQRGYIKTSEETPQYNCIAFTLGDQGRPWWPPVHPGLQHADSYWPAGVACQATVEAFVEMYAGQGFEVCDGAGPEAGYAKVVLYVEPREGLVEHAALLLASGRCISKMGFQEDIAHTVEGLTGAPHYFEVGRVMRCRVGDAPAALRELLVRYGGAGEIE